MHAFNNSMEKDERRKNDKYSRKIYSDEGEFLTYKVYDDGEMTAYSSSERRKRTLPRDVRMGIHKKHNYR